jgi:hypothetical protein
MGSRGGRHLVEFWRHKYEREGKTRRALEDSLQALAIEQGAMEKQGTPSVCPSPLPLAWDMRSLHMARRMAAARLLTLAQRQTASAATTKSAALPPLVAPIPGRATAPLPAAPTPAGRSASGSAGPPAPKHQSPSTTAAHSKDDDDDDDEFFDVEEAVGDSSAVPVSASDAVAVAVAEAAAEAAAVVNPSAVVPRRTTLPALMFDRSHVSLWTVIKDFVGKDLSKIAVPVYFNEPLSFLQKFSEDVEYHTLLRDANQGADKHTHTRARARAYACTCRERESGNRTRLTPSCARGGRASCGVVGPPGAGGGICDLALLGHDAHRQTVQSDPRRDI